MKSFSQLIFNLPTNKDMYQTLVSNFVLLSPLVFALTAFISRFQPGLRPKLIKRISQVSAITGVIVSIASIALISQNPLIETGFIGIADIGFSLRLDVISVTMLTMISLLTFIIVKFSMNYLDGDNRQGIFLGRLAATIASVQLLVLSGNIGILFISWVLTSITLHRLLVFYSDRIGAIIAAKKKFIVARLGDACLLIAVALLYKQFGTGNFETIFNQLKESSIQTSFNIELIALFLVLTAILKSAQFPFHGWLVEVMETPTPVSALLHAGLLNAGPFLIIRMAYVMEASSISPMILAFVGCVTALFASLVYLTQTSVKTALAFSSIAHMGFSLMICGIGGYPAAMLHMVAHSFYKAHAFLSSGSSIDMIRSYRIQQTMRLGSPLRILSGFTLALIVYSAFLFLWKIDFTLQLPLFVMGGIIVSGMSMIFISALDTDRAVQSILKVTITVVLVTASFFTLEFVTHNLISIQLPEISEASPGMIMMALVILFLFSVVFFAQAFISTFRDSEFFQKSIIHIKNGFYVNAMFDRTIGALKIEPPSQSKPIEFL